MRKVIVIYKEQHHDKNKNKLHKHLGRKCKVLDECEHLPRHFVLNDVDDETFAKLQADPDVEEVRWDSVVAEPYMAHALSTVSNMAQTPSYSISVSDTAQFHSRGITGAGVKVGIIDTGFANHEDLVYAERFDANGESPNICKDGHGTHVAGIIGARNNNVGILGVAPDCLIYGAKASRTDNKGDEKFWESDITSALNWLKGKQVKVINMSFGGLSGPSSKMESTYKSIFDAGIVLVASAGNDHNMQVESENNVGYPAKYSFVVAVSNIEQNHRITESSSTGPEITVAAPGYEINSTVPGPNNMTNPNEVSTVYDRMTGTSMAAPFVTGMIALYAQQYPNATRDQLINYLKTNTEKLGSPAGADAFYGAGRVITPWTTIDLGQGMSNPIILNGSANGTLPSNLNSIFYKYTAPSTGLHKFEITGLDYAIVHLFNERHRHIASNAGEGTEYISYELEAGQVIYICIEPFLDWEPAGKSYSLKATTLPFTGKAGEYFTNPFVLQSLSADLYQAQRGSSIYIKYVPSSSGTLEVRADYDPDGDRMVALDNMHLYDANRKRIATIDRDGMHSVVLTYNVVKDQTYYIELIRQFYSTVVYEPSRVTVNIPPKVVTTNPGDSFNNPILVSGTTANGTLQDTKDLFFKYTVLNTGIYTFTTSASFDSYMQLLDGSQNILAQDDDSAGSSQPKITYALSSGQIVYLKVYGYNHGAGKYGPITLHITSPSVGSIPGTANVSVGSPSTSSLTLSMSATGAASFNVYRSTSASGSYSLVASGVTSPYTDTGLSSNTMYYYKVAGVNSFGTGPQSSYAYGMTNSSGGVTPTTIVEDFTDSSFDPRLNLSLGGWEYDSTVGSISTTVADSTGPKSVTLHVDIPSGTTSRTLKLDHKGMVFGGSGVYHTQVFVNGVLKHTFTETDVQWRTQTINLGTGYQAIEIRASSTSSAWVSGIDNITISWR